MAPGIEFPEQNVAYRCDNIPNCSTLHVHAMPDAILGQQRISCHELSEHSRKEVAKTGLIYVGVFGELQPPIAVYAGSFPYPETPKVDAEAVGDRTIVQVLDGCKDSIEFLELYRWLHPAIQKTEAVCSAYERAEAKWPGYLYPLAKRKYELELPTTYEERLAALGWHVLTEDPNRPANWWESDQELFVAVQGLRYGAELPEPVAYSETSQKWYSWASLEREEVGSEPGEPVEITDLVAWQPFARVPEPPEQPEPRDDFGALTT